MRISDWSSDVCSSDLTEPTGWQLVAYRNRPEFHPAGLLHEILGVAAVVIAVVTIAIVPIGYFIVTLSQPHLLGIGRTIGQHPLEDDMVIPVQRIVSHAEGRQEVVHLVIITLTELPVDQQRDRKALVLEVVIPSADRFWKNASRLLEIGHRGQHRTPGVTDMQRAIFIKLEQLILACRDFLVRIITLVTTPIEGSVRLAGDDPHFYRRAQIPEFRSHYDLVTELTANGQHLVAVGRKVKFGIPREVGIPYRGTPQRNLHAGIAHITHVDRGRGEARGRGYRGRQEQIGRAKGR